MTSTSFKALIRYSDGDLFLVEAGSIELIARRSKYDPATNMELNTGDYVTCRCDNGVNYIVTKP